MSLIHEALKKAAAEGDTEKQELSPQALHLSVSRSAPRSYFWIFIGVLSFGLLSFLFSYQYKTIISRSSNKTVQTTVTPLSKIDLEKKQPEQKTPAAASQVGEVRSQTKMIKEDADGESALRDGISFYRKREFDHAYESFRKAVELIPSSPIAHNNLGLVLRQQGNLKEALGHYEEAVRLDSKYAEAENNMGLVQDQIGSIDEAIVHYKRAIGIKPEIAAFHLNYATLLERKGDFSTARKEYQLFLDLQGDVQSDLVPQIRSRLKELRGL